MDVLRVARLVKAVGLSVVPVAIINSSKIQKQSIGSKRSSAEREGERRAANE
jgi:hypothetical protein